MSQNYIDTIAACATPPGQGGIGVVRVSGPLVREITQKIVGEIPKPRFATKADFLAADGETVIDQGIAIYFPAPHSFTGDDVLELQGHGGQLVLDCVLQRVLEIGARLAKPGEFSERAFLNGKIDLTQAEAIADLISASSKQATQYAMRSLQGEFSRLIHKLAEKITLLRTLVEAAIDFAEEEVDFISVEKIQRQLTTIVDTLHNTQQAAEQGVLVQEGISVVITGKPNVGKSSLLNCLGGDELAIVTEIPGTTRDVVRAQIKLAGVNIQLVDTAGLRDSDDIVEKEGVKRALLEIDKAQHVLLVVDAAFAQDKTPSQLLRECLNWQNVEKRSQQHTIIYNKIDLIGRYPEIVMQDGITCIYVSVREKQGMDLLRKYLQESSAIKQTTENGFSARRRHLDALVDAEQHLMQAQQLSQSLQAECFANIELIAEELRQAQNYLGTITGEVSSDDLLERIFREFCIGK